LYSRERSKIKLQYCIHVKFLWTQKIEFFCIEGTVLSASFITNTIQAENWCQSYSERSSLHFKDDSNVRAVKFQQFKFRPHLACLHDHNISGFFGGPAFIQPIRAICIVFKKL